ncbi:hypothetical protein [Nicoliella lavandulae]|uniref:Bro-N domain-containing protein n=1 Tax=Nicoliella lavandulae TaxID=3082954 RepID=A0ABU8SKH4_9LACO
MKDVIKYDPFNIGFDLLNIGFVFVKSNSENEEPFTTSDAIAKNAGVDEESVKSLARNNKGVSRFKIRKLHAKNGRPREIFIFNEQQAIFIITLLRNTSRVIKFKYNLSVAFVNTRKLLDSRKLSHEQSKPVSKSLGESIRDNPNMNGSHDYANLNKLIYKIALNTTTNQLRKQRNIPKGAVLADYLTVDEQQAVNKVKNAVIALNGLNMAYADIKNAITPKQYRLLEKVKGDE